MLGFLLLLCCAGALAMPAAARSSHNVVHAVIPVIDGEHHHHNKADDVASEQKEDTADPKAADKTGHSHLPAPVLDLTLPAGLDNRAVLPISEQLKASDTPALPTLSWIPPIRPPITA